MLSFFFWLQVIAKVYFDEQAHRNHLKDEIGTVGRKVILFDLYYLNVRLIYYILAVKTIFA